MNIGIIVGRILSKISESVGHETFLSFVKVILSKFYDSSKFVYEISMSHEDSIFLFRLVNLDN